SGVRGNAGQVNYSSAKAAVTGMTRTLAKEWGRYAVTVNCVAFGYIQTRLTKPLSEGESGTIEVAGRQVKVGVQGARIAAMNQMIPLGRGGFPAEAARSEEHTSELQSLRHLVCRLLLEKKKQKTRHKHNTTLNT